MPGLKVVYEGSESFVGGPVDYLARRDRGVRLHEQREVREDLSACAERDDASRFAGEKHAGCEEGAWAARDQRGGSGRNRVGVLAALRNAVSLPAFTIAETAPVVSSSTMVLAGRPLACTSAGAAEVGTATILMAVLASGAMRDGMKSVRWFWLAMVPL